MRLMTAVLAGLLASTACAPSPALIAPVETRTPITFSQLLAGPRTAADERIAYGPDALQFGELWLPRRQGRHPVIVLIHGGCWRADLPGLELMDYMAADLRDRGYAVWNLEYRRIGHPGGGYPGTFRDIAAGVDHLRTIAAPHSLDLRRVALAGHSAGGHLALWAAARDRLPAESPLRTARPLPIRGVVSLAGIADLDAYRQTGPDACGGPSTIDGLVGVQEPRRPERLCGHLAPRPAAAGRSSGGDLRGTGCDRSAPLRPGLRRCGRPTGDRAGSIVLEGAGHFELIDPTSASWPRVLDAFAGLLR